VAKAHKHIQKIQINPVNRKTQLVVLLTVLAVAIGAGMVILRSSALTSYITTESETGTVTGPAVVITDATASGGKAIRFGTVDTRTYTNPVKVSTADPGVIEVDNRYYLVSTAGTPTFRISTSTDLVNWTYTGNDIFNGTHPWAKDSFWAPEIHQTPNGYAVYYTASSTALGRLAIGVATSSSILGPYKDLGKPLVGVSTYGNIDPTFFRDDDGRKYLYWKENAGNTRIFAQELNQAGTAFIGSRTTVLQKGLAWEGTVGIEGPWVMKRGVNYYLFYSGELFSTAKYSVGVARSATPLGTYTKKGDPILTSSTRWKGPGHNSVVSFGANDYMVYHAWDVTPGAGDRKGLLDKITWISGWPTVGNGHPTESPQLYPQ
jgi:beta-xylosidase